MARPGLRTHPKFIRLQRRLKIPAPHALGLLEFLWERAYEAGNPIIGDAETVAIVADWQGDAAEFVKALHECGGEGCVGFIEPCHDDTQKWQIHDLYDHAPQYVQRRMERESQREARGQTISDMRAKAVSMRKDRQNNKKLQTATNESHLLPPVTNGYTPARAPALAPARLGEVSPNTPLEQPSDDAPPLFHEGEEPQQESEQESRQESPQRERRRSKSWTEEQLASIYDAYPRKRQRQDAIRAIGKALIRIRDEQPDVSDPVDWLLKRTQQYAESREGKPEKFTPYPASWFNSGDYASASWKEAEEVPKVKDAWDWKPRKPTPEELAWLRAQPRPKPMYADEQAK